MARKRIIYQSEALFCGPTGATQTGDGIIQLHRIQDISQSVDISRTDINEFGQLSYIAREVTEPPTVGLDFTYFAVGGYNESGLGLTLSGPPEDAKTAQIVSGFMGASDDRNTQKNYYVLTVPEGEDATAGYNGSGTAWSASQAAKNAVIGFGNGFLSSYTLDAAVGDIPSASVSVEAQNINYSPTSKEFPSPTINPLDGTAVDSAFNVTLPTANSGVLGVAALRPGDVVMDFEASTPLAGGGVSLDTSTGILVQNFSLEVPLARTPISKLGEFTPFARPLDVPATATLSVNAIIAEAYESGNLADLLCSDGPGTRRDITITMYEKCGREGSDESIRIDFKGAYLDSQNMSASIGDNKTVDLSFSTQTAGPGDTDVGVFMSGKDVGKVDLGE